MTGRPSGGSDVTPTVGADEMYSGGGNDLVGAGAVVSLAEAAVAAGRWPASSGRNATTAVRAITTSATVPSAASDQVVRRAISARSARRAAKRSAGSAANPT